MIAGSIFAFGPVGARVGAGMKRGTLALFGVPDPADPRLCPRSRRAGRYRPPVLTLYLRGSASGGSRSRSRLSPARSSATMATSSSMARARSWSGPDRHRLAMKGAP